MGILTRTISLCFALLIVIGGVAYAAETPIPEAPTQWVTDTASFLSPQAAEALNSRLQEYERSTGHQLIVYIGQTTGDAPIEDWAVKAFAKWKVGRKGIDDGLVLFIMAADRKLRFEVGYGLEPVVPDAIASRVINDVIVPRVQQGDRDGAVTAGMDAVMTVIGGGGLPAASDEGIRRQVTFGQLIVFGIIGLVILFVLVTNPSLALWLLVSMLSGGNNRRGGGGWSSGGGGWGGGGGGFGGGGGSSGGGGATGSW